MRIRLAAAITAFVTFGSSLSVVAAEVVPSDAEALGVVRALLRQSEDDIDLARAKLTVDKLIDPTIDIGFLPGRSRDYAKFQVLRKKA